ncbi:unnamed protein product [Bursaphelenchus xylophilus]|uniref:aspartate transaminase n=1 Tax=Bursaphelenchus xylophilus TaxID=6326 RepID=A0A1I7SMF4_BURXY|nr:unnamed protein product [Bursaphelenchus xylophilus]CAG9130170.1 unnamed protein product [Bursaphelenchus xylophilus]
MIRTFSTSLIRSQVKARFVVSSPRKPSLFELIRPTNEPTTSLDVPKAVVNLSIDTYRNENGQPWSLPVVREVEKQLALDEDLDHDYVDPQIGHKPFIEYSTHLLLGQHLGNVLKDNVVALQTVSATGALRLGLEFAVKVLGLNEAHLANPSWTDYGIILQNAGINRIREYPYWDYEQKKLAFESMAKTLKYAEPGSIIILQCGHNPTGVDPDPSQWRRLAEIVKDKDLVPFFDVTNIGLFSGDPQEDASPIRLFAELGVEFFVAQSFSKNFGLYSERVGNLLVVSKDPSKTREIKEYLVQLSRGLWSSAPLHGARIVGHILKTQYMREQWLNQVRMMFMRTQKSRNDFYKALMDNKTPGTWDHIIQSSGLFCLLGLSEPQRNYLFRKHNVFIAPSGRINVCALTNDNIVEVVRAVDDSVRNS